MSSIKITTLFKSNLFRVDEYKSPFVAPQINEEEWTQTYSVAFVCAGNYLCYSPLGLATANSNHILYFNPQQPYQIRRPLAAQEHTIDIIFNHTLLFELLALPLNKNNPDTLFKIDSALLNLSQMLQVHQLLYLIKQNDELDTLAIEESITVLICNALDAAGQLKVDAIQHNRTHEELVRHVKLIIGDQFDDKLSLEQISQQVHLSPYHLSRVFKQYTGITLYQYILQLRLSAALKRLSESPSQDLSSLAYQLGFSSHSHFSSTFSKIFGMAPSKFRQSAVH